jgi:hypothetical protein
VRYTKSVRGNRAFGHWHEIDEVHMRTRCGVDMSTTGPIRIEEKPLVDSAVCPQCLRDRKRAEKAAHDARRGH